MSKKSPLIIIEDDEDDFHLLKMAAEKIGIPNDLKWFQKAAEAYDYLLAVSERPFIIMCDINMPGLNGIDFKKKIDATPVLREKSIPFIYYTTTDDAQTVDLAYTHLTIQGFFKKDANYANICSDLKLITDYWRRCRHPNSDR